MLMRAGAIAAAFASAWADTRGISMSNDLLRRCCSAIALTACCCVSAPATACATCGCTADSDAAMGYSSESGWRVNLEYVYINQDELRSGTSTATPAEVVNHPFDPALNGGEIEQDTINRYLNLGLSYRPNADWNFSLIAPWVIRGHSTYGVQTQPYSPAETAADQRSYSECSQLGDIRVLAA
jgi:hypothetical protein